MAMRQAEISINGITPLLQNNPQTVDRFNPYARRMAAINAKKTRRTDDDYRELQDIEVRAKIYFDEEVGIYIPATWVLAAIANNGYRVAKISRDDVRGALFTTEDKIKLHYDALDKVKTPEDIVGNPYFRINLTLPQGKGVRVIKAAPIFHKWHFATLVEFDDKIIDPDSLTRICEHMARYGGFGDFRPTFGRAIAEVRHV